METNTILYQLPEIHYLKLRFHLVSAAEARLPAFKGSMLRGAFGHALRKTVCAIGPQTDCADCMLKQQCAYTRLFETFITGQPPRFLRGLDTSPRPLVFETVDTSQTLEAGQPLPFDLVLFGSATEFVPYVVFAVFQMAQTGLGHQRHRFQLEQADCQQVSEDNPTEFTWRQLYDAASQSLLFAPIPILLQNTQVPANNPHQLRLKFLTPTRLQSKGDYTTEFNFRHLVFKMLRRVLELAYFHEPEAEINWEFHDLLVAADKVNIAQRNLHWSDWQRYSNRQHSKVKMGGFVGDLLLEGELEPFMELLSYIEVLHFGKGTVFGLGKITVNNEINNKT